MKKLVTTLGILVLVGALAAPVFAHRWGWGGHPGGPGYGRHMGGPYGNLTESQRVELDKVEQKFFNDTAKLKDEIWAKSAELNTLLNSSDPDAKKARALQKEISNLRAKMGEERITFELEARKTAPNSGYGRGYGMGYGRHHMGGPGGPYGQHGPYGHGGPHGGGYGYGPCGS
jgi:zinc resistance-associated protein